MDFPVKFNNVLPIPLFLEVNSEIASSNTEYVYGNSSYQEEKKFFGQKNRWDRLIYYKAGTTIALKIKKVLKENIRIARIHSGAKLFGSQPEFHKDFCEKYLFTFVIFTNLSWNTNWGGEFVVKNPYTEEYNYVPYIPNTGVLIPSYWEHTGNSPNCVGAGLRTSVAFSYCKSSKYKEFISNNPHLKLYS